MGAPYRFCNIMKGAKSAKREKGSFSRVLQRKGARSRVLQGEVRDPFRIPNRKSPVALFRALRAMQAGVRSKREDKPANK